MIHLKDEGLKINMVKIECIDQYTRDQSRNHYTFELNTVKLTLTYDNVC